MGGQEDEQATDRLRGGVGDRCADGAVARDEGDGDRDVDDGGGGDDRQREADRPKPCTTDVPREPSGTKR